MPDQQIINVGSTPNDGEGDSLRTAFTKCNTNFTSLFGTSGLTGIQNGNSNISIPVANGNVVLSATGVANVLSVGPLGGTFTGNLLVTNTANLANIQVPGTIVSQGTIQSISDMTAVNISASANLVSANLTVTNGVNTSFVSASGNITGGNIIGNTVSTHTGNVITTGIVSATGNITGGNVVTGGNVTGAYILGDGGFLSNVTVVSNVAVSQIANGTTSFTVLGSGGNVQATVGAIANIMVLSTSGAEILGIMSATGNVTGGNLRTTGQVSATGNVTGGNLITAGTFQSASITSTGNITGGNLITGGLATVTGNITVGNISTAGLATVTGNVTGGNLITTGRATVSGNITGGNLITAGLATVSGNITSGANFVATANITGGNLITAGLATVSGNITGGNIITAGLATVSGNITGGNIITAGLATAGSATVTGNITGGNLLTGGIISATGNVTGNYILGNGALLTGVITSVANINLGNSNVTVTSSGGNIAIGIGGTSNVAVYATTGEYISGVISATGNITGANLITSGLATVTGNITGGNLNTGGQVSAVGNVTGANVNATTSITTGNITGGNLLTGGQVSATGNVRGGNLTINGSITVNSNGGTTAIVNGGSNAVGNIGSSGGYFNTVFATATTALYADLAENYVADQAYAPGTVVEFGGEYEITLAEDSTSRVAGIVSHNPAYLMNAGQTGDNVVPVALMGRVPCRVRGVIKKGDLLISGGGGFARPKTETYIPGSVIGKALENHPGGDGIITVVVGRL